VRQLNKAVSRVAAPIRPVARLQPSTKRVQRSRWRKPIPATN